MSDQYQTPRNRFWKFRFLMPLVIALAVMFFGMLVMVLWNNILPEVAPVKTITFWQAVGLLFLCRILFGGFGRGSWGGRGSRPGKPAWRNKWMNMSEEERATFQEEWRKRCGRPIGGDDQRKSGNA